jgi:hypothetical protein
VLVIMTQSRSLLRAALTVTIAVRLLSTLFSAVRVRAASGAAHRARQAALRGWRHRRSVICACFLSCAPCSSALPLPRSHWIASLFEGGSACCIGCVATLHAPFAPACGNPGRVCLVAWCLPRRPPRRERRVPPFGSGALVPARGSRAVPVCVPLLLLVPAVFCRFLLVDGCALPALFRSLFVSAPIPIWLAVTLRRHLPATQQSVFSRLLRPELLRLFKVRFTVRLLARCGATCVAESLFAL